jgi:hypothetical protein
MESKHHQATVESALTQVLAAYGHGLGGLIVSHAAAKAGVDRFRPVITEHLEEWDQNLLAIHGYATLLGKVTAGITLSRGSDVVTVKDFLKGLKIVEGGRGTARFIGCPFFHHHPKNIK